MVNLVIRIRTDEQDKELLQQVVDLLSDHEVSYIAWEDDQPDPRADLPKQGDDLSRGLSSAIDRMRRDP